MDHLLINARVSTMDPAHPFAEAVAVTGARISAVGATAELLAKRERHTAVLDLGGRTLLPGFVDAHNHFGPTTFEPRGVDVSPARAPDIPSIQAHIAAAARATPPGGWIRAYGYAEQSLAERRHPTRWELDEAAPDHPVVLLHSSYHRAVANSRALELAGIVHGHTYLPNGTIDCDPAGEPIGIVAEAATNPLQRLSIASLMERHAAELLALVEANGRRHLALGITSVQDAWVPPVFLDLYRRAAEAGRVPLYLAPLRGSARGLFDSPVAWLDTPPDGDLPPRLRRGGVKFFADGAGVTAATRTPGHGGEPEGVDEGILFYPPGELDALVARAHRQGHVVAIHAIGNRGIAAALAAVAHARRTVPAGDARLRIDHFFWGTEEDIARLRTLEAGIVTQPVGVWQYGDRTLARPRHPRFLNYPLGQLRAAGVPVAGSSDAPCFALPPLWGIAAAVERRTLGGAPFWPEQALSVEEAIRAYTLGAAWAGGTEGEEGSITPGKLANFVVLAEDPAAVPPARIRDLVVEETWVDGVPAYRRAEGG
jgi:predicted amidohydrolase YtcJ